MQLRRVTGVIHHDVLFDKVSGFDCVGLAISHDGRHMVISSDSGTVAVYSLPDGAMQLKIDEHVLTHGLRSSKRAKPYVRVAKICFSATGNVLVAERYAHRVQEVTLAGKHVRLIAVEAPASDGVKALGDADGCECIAANAELIAVGLARHAGDADGNRILLLDAATGALVRSIGPYGAAPGQVLRFCHGVRFTPDNSCVVVAHHKYGDSLTRVSVFTLAGEHVMSLPISAQDVDFDDSGDLLTCDYLDGCDEHSITKHSLRDRDGQLLFELWHGSLHGTFAFECSTAAAMSDGLMYVLSMDRPVVRVYG